MADDPDDFLFGNLSLVCEPSTKRQTCQRCQRPASLCICYSLPIQPIPVHTNIIILQHPNEVSCYLHERRCVEYEGKDWKLPLQFICVSIIVYELFKTFSSNLPVALCNVCNSIL
jgi:hypothetical protein